MPLASPGSPYVSKSGEITLADGTNDAIGKGDVTVGAPIARTHTPKRRRSFKELPTDPKTQTAVIVVLIYSLLGLTENEIAHVINVDPSDVHQLKHHPAYQETFELLFFELIAANSNSLQAKIASMAPVALESLLEVMKDGKQEVARVRAADSVLDRSGLRAEELFEQKNDTGFDSLKIIISDADDHKSNVEVNIERNNNGNRR